MQLRKSGLFSSLSPEMNNWRVIQSHLWWTVFFHRGHNKLLGLGKYNGNHYFGGKTQTCWTIPLHQGVPIKDVAVGTHHFLVLYENGVLEGYAHGSSGQLGVGSFRNDELMTVSIQLPDNEIPASITADEYHSFVISKTGKLYGFGDNKSGQLGLGSNIRSVLFPTVIPLLEGAIASRIYTRDDKTLVVCQGGEIFGFGSNYERIFGNIGSYGTFGEVSTPARLRHVEDLKPKSLALGNHALVVLSHDGKCYFYGTSYDCVLPIDYRQHLIELPKGVTPKAISLTHNHFMLLSDANELWGVSQQKCELERIALPQNQKIKSVVAGYKRTFIFDENDHCYVMGENDEYQLGDEQKGVINEPVLLNLDRMSVKAGEKYLYTKMICMSPSLAEKSYAAVAREAGYQDHSAMVDELKRDVSRVVEITRPSGFGKSVMLGMLHAEFAKEHPVILLDFGELDYRDSTQFQKSYEALIAKLYIKFRRDLFNGELSEVEFDHAQYQSIACQRSRFYDNKQLVKMVGYLHRQYGKQVILLIDHADHYQRHSPNAKERAEIESRLKQALDPGMKAKIIIMATHPTPFSHTTQPVFSEHGVLSSGSVYAKYFSQSYLPAAPFKISSQLEALRMSPADCVVMSELLAGKTVERVIKEEHGMHLLIREGLVQANVTKVNASVFALQVVSQQAKAFLEPLHRKWLTQNMKRVTVVFDIDEVLAVHDKCDANTARYFLEKGAILYVCGVTHYIVPGVLELMQHLFSKPDVKVAFFSSGAERRNKPFVSALLIKALGEARYNELAKEVPVYSENNLKQYERLDYQTETFCFHNAYGKKNVEFALAAEDSIHQAILVDDKPEFVYPEQAKNYLYAKTVLAEHFAALGTPNVKCENAEDILFRRVNAIFHVAGVLDGCIAHCDRDLITQKLFSMHFIDKPVNNTLVLNDDAVRSPRSYQHGLKVLQQYNSSLTLNTPDSYHECVSRPQDDVMRKQVDEAREREYKGESCMVM